MKLYPRVYMKLYPRVYMKLYPSVYNDQFNSVPRTQKQCLLCLRQGKLLIVPMEIRFGLG